MKLKLVVASMSVLGLVSCPVFAATNASTTMSKHHHRAHHKVAQQDYKDMGALPYKDQPACMMSQNAMIMVDMTQNNGRSLPNPCNPGWFNRIAVSGGVNADIKFGNTNGNFMGENYQTISLNDAYLNLAADVTEWAKAFASLSYSNPTVSTSQASAIGNTVRSEYSAAYSNNIGSTSPSTIQLEQGYAMLGNLDESPFFIQIGKYYQDFSRYDIHPITRSFTQVMSETLAPAIGAGFVTGGFSGQVYAFDNPINKIGKTNSSTNYGAALGYNKMSDSLGWDLGIGYLNNLIGVNDIAYIVNQDNQSIAGTSGYNSNTSGGAAYADVNSGPFTIGARYTQAFQKFNANDLVQAPGAGTGAKPWAAGIQAGYSFDAFSRNNNIYVGYQETKQAVTLQLPKYRWLAGYGLDVFGKNTNVGIEWDYDSDYSQTAGGSGNSYNLVSIRSTVKFG